MGDYKHLPKAHPLTPISYYQKAIETILDKFPNIRRVIYFCESEDNIIVENHILHLASIFPTLEFVKASDKLQDWEQVLVMSNLDYHVIPNSTFSWWGAYFSNQKIVTYPSIWFGPKLKHHITKDLCPKNWIKI